MAEADASLPRHMTPARTSSRWRRAWLWVVVTRARRSALTLAVLAAMAAAFATGSYDPDEADLYSSRYVPLTAEDRAKIIARWGEDTDTAGCETIRPGLPNLYCVWDRRALAGGARMETYFSYLSLSQYVAYNGAVMLATLMMTFVVLTAGMAAVRKWWRWLW